MNLALMFIYTYTYNIILYVYLAFFIFANISFSSVRINVVNVSHVHKSWGLVELIFLNMKWIMVFSSTFRRKKVELLSSLRRQRLGRLSFLSESISQKLSKVSIWNLFTIKRGTNYNKADDPVICISRVICPCFDIVHRN